MLSDEYSSMLPFKYWIRHIAAVPKGFLRYHVLELLNEKPLCGSEIMSEIEKQTNGCWRPSPGSIYPLLAWLQDNSYIREVSTVEGGVKRYTLTDKGRKLLEEQRKVRELLKDKFFAQSYFNVLLFSLPVGKAAELQESSRRLLRAFINISVKLKEKFSEQVFREILRTLNEAADKLEEINRRLEAE
ncbi:MAG: PadR family transcriptional regulator [Candidatus Methanomethylicia archaeon]